MKKFKKRRIGQEEFGKEKRKGIFLPAALAVFLLIVAMSKNVYAGGAYTVGLGQTVILNAQLRGNVRVTSGWWACNSPYAQIISQSGTTCVVQGLSSTGEGRFVYVSYNYSYYDPVLGYTGSDIDQFKIVVQAPPPQAVFLSPESLSLVLDSGAQLTPSLFPDNAATTYRYSSSNSNIVQVDNKGYVTGGDCGNAVVTVTTANNKTAECPVTVYNPALRLSNTNPGNGAVEIPDSQVIAFTYNQKVTGGDNFSDIKIIDNTAEVDVEASVSIDKRRLLVTPAAKLHAGHLYTVELPAGAVKQIGGTDISEETETSFTVKAVEFTSDLAGKENIDVDEKIEIRCGDAIQKGEKWEEISLENETGRGNVPIAPEIQENILTINPVENLDYKTQYKLNIPVGAVESYEGIQSASDWAVSFSTKPGSLSVSVAHPGNNAEEVPVNTQLQLNFNYQIAKGDAFEEIIFRNMTSGQNVLGTVSTGIDTVKFIPGDELDYGCKYQLKIPAGALKNEIGEANGEQFLLEFSTISKSKKPVQIPNIEIEDGIVTITSEYGANIYYTLDGANPMINGVCYSRPISVLALKGTIRAVAVKNGSVSEESSKNYEVSWPLRRAYSNFGGSGDDEYNAIAALSDGHVAVGYSQRKSFENGRWEETAGNGGTDAIIIKYDASGNVEWKKNFGGSGDDKYTGTAPAEDGCVAVGFSSSFGDGDWSGTIGHGGKDAVIVKYDKAGNVEWKKNFGGVGDDEYYSVAETEDGGCIAGGYSSFDSFGNGDWESVAGKKNKDAIIVKYDKAGNVEWKKNFGGGGDDAYNSVAAAEDGCVAVGYTVPNAIYATIVKYDKAGNVEWERAFGGRDSVEFYSVVAVEDGYTTVGGASPGSFDYGSLLDVIGKGSSDAIIVKYDKNGTVKWKKNFGGKAGDGYKSLIAVESGYIAVGFSQGESFEGRKDWAGIKAKGIRDAIIVKHDENGNVEWKKNFGGAGQNSFTAVAVSKGGCIAAGYTECGGFYSGDWVNVLGNGAEDAMVVQYDERELPKHDTTTLKEGAVSVYSKDTFVKGERFTADMFLRPAVNVSAVNIVLRYPSCISYLGQFSGYDSVNVDEQQEGTEKVLRISCNFTADNPVLEKDISYMLASLSFQVNEDCDYGIFNLEFSPEECFMRDADDQQTAFSETKGQEFSVVSANVQQFSIVGSEKISIPVQYRVAAFPQNVENISVQWSVSDESAASIDEDGRLNPLKNGNVTIHAVHEPTGTEASLAVEISGIKTYIENISSDVGKFAENYDKTDLKRVLYVEENTDLVHLTADYQNGTFNSDEYGEMKSGRTREFYMGTLPKTILFTKSETEHDDTVYEICIRTKPFAEKKPEIQINYSEEKLTGFQEGEKYSVDGKIRILSSGELPIRNGMFGKTLTIVKKGNQGDTLDSEEQQLSIPARPLKPCGLKALYSAKNKVGKISGVSLEMEYKKYGTDSWTECGEEEITGLRAGIYRVRIKPTLTAFASGETGITVNSKCAEMPEESGGGSSPSLTPPGGSATPEPSKTEKDDPTPPGNSVTPEPSKIEKDDPTPPVVTVTPVPDIEITRLSISCVSKKIAVGKKTALRIVASPKSVKAPKVLWEVNNINYASVSRKGVVKIKKRGAGKTITVTASAMDGSRLKASIRLKGMKHAVTRVRIKKAPKTLKRYKSVTLRAVVKTTGKNANKMLKWSTSNSKFATVNSKGQVTAKKTGKGKTVTITASSTDGSNKKASVKIKIK